MVVKYFYPIALLGLLSAGCSLRQAGYTVVGAGGGGAIGYAIHHDKKEAAIGAAGGALAGNLIAQWQDKSEKNKHDKSYREGYNQAQVDVAVKNWDQNTGKGSQPQKKLVSITLPKREENGIVYDEREITVEDEQ